jgi:hypothetical protein
MRPFLLDYVESLGHAVFEKGQYNLNIIGIRSKTHEPNKFDDRICVVCREEMGWVTRTWEATCDPGQYWLDNPMRVEGTAILVPGQYRSVYKIGTHRTYTALTQRGGRVKVYRDGNKDEILDRDPESITEGYYGINIHKAGKESTEINKWSAGCQVFANEKDFEEFMSICMAAKSLWGDTFTYTLIDEPEL